MHNGASSPAIDTSYFPGTNPGTDAYLSSDWTPDGYIWAISFSDGSSVVDYGALIRLVHSGP